MNVLELIAALSKLPLNLEIRTRHPDSGWADCEIVDVSQEINPRYGPDPIVILNDVKGYGGL